MKKTLSYILSFIIYLSSLLIVSILIFNNELSIKQTKNILDKTNYYENALTNINKKIDTIVIDENLSKEYNNYFNKSMIIKDINTLLKDKETEISHYDKLYKIIEKYDISKESKDKYTKKIDEIYQKNIFPIKEYRIINKLYLNNNQSLYLSIILVLITFFTSIVLLLINKNIYYHKISMLALSITLIMPKVLLTLFNIFKNFVYSNTYFTNYFLKILYNIENKLFIIGLLIILLILLNKIINSRTKN